MEDRDLEARFRLMADVPVLVWIAGPDGRCVFLNRRWLEFTGRPLEQELGDGWLHDVHPDDVADCIAATRDAVEHRKPTEIEYRLRRTDGAWRWMLDRSVPLFDGTGAFTGVIGTCVDLTERREAEVALQRSRQDLAAAMAAGHMGSFDLNLATGRVARDRNLELLYGLRPGEAGTLEEWAELVHADDRVTLLNEVARVTADGGEYHLEHRVVRPDGELRWVERRGHAYRDDSGQVVGLRGMVIDVTARKVAEAERADLMERVSRLQGVTAALARAGTPNEVLEIMVAEGFQALGAAAGSVAILDATGDALEVVRAIGYPVEIIERFGRIILGTPVPLADAVRTRTPVTCRDLDDWGRQYPDLLDHVPRDRHQAAAAFPLVVDDRLLGGVGLSFASPQHFDAAQMEFLESVAAQCAQALDRAWSYTAEADARRSAEAAGARLALLAEASSVLAGSMEYETTLPAVATLAVGVLGECCAVHVVEPSAHDASPRWKQAAAAHVDPDGERALSDVPAAAWQQAATGTGRVESLRELGVRSVIGVPLLARGRTLGVLSVGRTSSGAFSAADRSLATDLGARVAQAVDNAMLYRAERQAHERAETAAVRLRFLLDVSTTLASPLGLQPRLERLAHQSVESLSDVCVIDLVEEDGSIRRVAAAAANAVVEPLTAALSAGDRIHPGSRHPVVAAVEHRRTELLVDLTDEDLRAMTSGDDSLQTVRALEPLSCVAVPLLAGTRAVGAITLLTTARSGRRYGPADLIFVEDVARRVAMGLESARMHEEMRRVAQTLQASLLPSVPPGIPGLEVGTRYVAAGEGTVVGGDFFDVFALGPGSWAVVVGDVCGKGVEAATVTGLARHTLRSSAMDHSSPATVLRHLNDILLRVGAEGGSEVEPRFCTVCLARIELTTRGAAVTLSMGGHPLPYVLEAGGALRQVGRPGSLLGVIDTPTMADEEHHLGPGDALILYTDGITERHTGDTFFGEDGIEEVLTAAAGLTADGIAGRLEEAARRFVKGQPSDDMAVVVVRVPPLEEPDRTVGHTIKV